LSCINSYPVIELYWPNNCVWKLEGVFFCNKLYRNSTKELSAFLTSMDLNIYASAVLKVIKNLTTTRNGLPLAYWCNSKCLSCWSKVGVGPPLAMCVVWNIKCILSNPLKPSYLWLYFLKSLSIASHSFSVLLLAKCLYFIHSNTTECFHPPSLWKIKEKHTFRHECLNYFKQYVPSVLY